MYRNKDRKMQEMAAGEPVYGPSVLVIYVRSAGFAFGNKRPELSERGILS